MLHCIKLFYVKMETLCLGNNPLYDEGASIASKCIHIIDNIYLEKSNIGDQGIATLASEIKKRRKPV